MPRSPAWDASEQRVRSVALHHHVVVSEGLLGHFTERLHPRSHGKFAAKPGALKGRAGKAAAKRGAEARASHYERLKTPEGQEHLSKIRGRMSHGEWLEHPGSAAERAMSHYAPRTAHATSHEQQVSDAKHAAAKAERDRIKAEDEAYKRGVAQARMDWRKSLTPKERHLHDAFDAAHKAWAAKMTFDYDPPEETRAMRKARAALDAHEAKHGKKRPKFPEQPYRHVSEP
jgi:hypothetical protein